MGVWNPISNTECCTVTYNGICTKDSSLCWDQILTPCTLGDSSTKAVTCHTLPRNFSAELSSAIIAAVEGPYHLAGGDCGRKAERGFNGTPFSSPDLRKTLLIPERREMTLVKDITRDPKNSAWKRQWHMDEMEHLAMDWDFNISN